MEKNIKKGRRFVKEKCTRMNISIDKKSLDIIDMCCYARNMGVSELFRTLAKEYARNILKIDSVTTIKKEETSNEESINEREELEKLKALRREKKEGALND